jgi:hypothetical protein
MSRFVWILACIIASGCSRQPADIVLDCSTVGDSIRDIIRIRPAQKAADVLSFSPARTGTAEITNNEYIVRLHVPPMSEYELLFRLNRFTSEGSREMIRPDGTTDSTTFYRVSCHPYDGKPL